MTPDEGFGGKISNPTEWSGVELERSPTECVKQIPVTDGNQ